MKNWQVAVGVAVGALTILGAFGFTTPAMKAEKVADKVEALEKNDARQDQDIAVMKRDIDYTARGIQALLDKEGLTPRPRRRRE